VGGAIGRPAGSTTCGARCSPSSSTTSSPARRSPGCTPTPRPCTPTVAAELVGASRRRRPLAPAGAELANVDGPRTRRGGRDDTGVAPHGPGQLVDGRGPTAPPCRRTASPPPSPRTTDDRWSAERGFAPQRPPGRRVGRRRWLTSVIDLDRDASSCRRARRRGRSSSPPTTRRVRRLGSRVVDPRRRRDAIEGAVHVEVLTKALSWDVCERPGVRLLVHRGHLRAACREPSSRHRCRSRLARVRGGTSRWRSRSTCAPTRPAATSSSGRSSVRCTVRRRGTTPSSRCAPTVSSTSPNTASAWPCSTTAATATACSTGGCGSPWLGPPATPIPPPTGHHEVTVGAVPARPRLAEVVAEAERFNCAAPGRRRSRRRGGRRRRSSR
jgi:hypothetical protein